nr:shikimate kinase [uncultured Eisenbergiella sp.]
MTILLFGVSNVGKTTIGKLLAETLGYYFFDLDKEVKKHYNTTLEDFVNVGTLESRDRKRGKVIDKIMKNEKDKVFAISPISYPENFNHYLRMRNVLAIELTDTAEHIFERLVFSDENDTIYKDDEYKNAHKENYIADIEDNISWYGKSYINIKNKFDMKNDLPEIIVRRIIKTFNLA